MLIDEIRVVILIISLLCNHRGRDPKRGVSWLPLLSTISGKRESHGENAIALFAIQMYYVPSEVLSLISANAISAVIVSILTVATPYESTSYA